MTTKQKQLIELWAKSIPLSKIVKKGSDLYWEIYRDFGFTGVRENAKYAYDQIRNYRIQVYLLSYGLYKYTVDGIWGPGTRRALNKYFKGPGDNYLFDKLLGFYGLLEDKIDQTIKIKTKYMKKI